MERYVIGFGFEYDKDGNALFLEVDDVTRLIEGIAAREGVLCYSLRFGPGAWQNDDGARVAEQGGTLEYVGSETLVLVLRRFAESIRDALNQESVVFYFHPVSHFEYV